MISSSSLNNMINKRISSYIIVILFLSPLVMNSGNNENVQAWGLVTHQALVVDVMGLMDPSWETAFDYYSPEVVGGSTYPDQVLQDWDNHLYYPVSGEHNAPWKVTEMVEEIRTFAANEDWDDFFFFLGIVSHYTADVNIPVHTYENWPGHSAYETDINYHLDELSFLAYNYDPITNITEFIIDCATHAYTYYWTIRDAYPDGETSDVVTTNSTIQAITEEQLDRAAGAILSVWEYILSTVTPPTITEVPDIANVLIDRAHENDYAVDDELSSFYDSLDRDVLSVEYNYEEFNTTSLAGVDLVVITAPDTLTNFTTAEITALTNWYYAGGHVLITSRGDFNWNINYGTMNELLASLGSDIRINDDNVYTSTYDPEYYKDWYCATGNFNLDPEVAYITENITRKVQFFSPSSLYSETGAESVNWLVYGEEYFYQSDEDYPPPEEQYDMVDDGVGGDIIPLAGVEVNGSSSVAVFGTTLCSNFDYGLTFRDNVFIIYNTIEYLLGIDIESNDDYEPYVEPTESTTPTPSDSAFPFLGILGSATIIAVLITVYRRKNKN